MRVGELAKASDHDLDEVLVTLWDAGIDDVEGPNDLVPARSIRVAMSALGMRAGREHLTIEYWIVASGLTRDQLASRLADVGIQLTPGARRIPKNSLRRLEGLFKAQPPVASASSVVETPPQQLPPFEYRIVGSTPLKELLSEEQVLGIHEALEEDFARTSDPISPSGPRDIGLLSSAVNRPKTSIGDTLKYPTVEMSAAALFHSLTLNHPFHNGNKRTALVALLAVLDANDVVLKCSENDLFRFTLKVAQHGLVPVYADQIADREVQAIAEWLKSCGRRVDRGERTMKWIRLRQRLKDFGVVMDWAPGVGNRMNLNREVEVPALFGLRKKRVALHTQVFCQGDGSDVDKSVIHKIRRDLELDDEHDVDSAMFYEGAEVDSFIIDYRRILRRLARL